MMWNLICVVIFFISLVFILIQYRGMNDLITLFLFSFLWFRLLLPFLHQYSMQSIVFGMSGTALATISIFLIGSLFISFRHIFTIYVMPFYAIITIVIISGIGNSHYPGLINDLSHWLFFFVVALLSLRAMENHGVKKILLMYFTILVPALVLQMIGFTLGQKSVGLDGEVVYMGGYYTESGFWKVLFALICVSSLLRTKRDLVPLIVSLICLFGVYLTAHRTAMMAALPVLVFLAMSTLGHLKVPALKVLLVMLAVVAILPLIAIVPTVTPERYQAIFAFGANLDLAFADPATLTDEVRRLGTGRIGIWSELLYRWRSGTDWHHIFGFGPGTASPIPHNEFIASLYQVGLIGLIAFVGMLLWQTVLMIRVSDRLLATRLLGCMAGFFMTCFTSNQVQAIEGLLILAIICATTWAGLEGRAPTRVGPPTMAPDGGPRAGAKIGARWTKTGVAARTTSAS